jgi:hypothetical protein
MICAEQSQFRRRGHGRGIPGTAFLCEKPRIPFLACVWYSGILGWRPEKCGFGGHGCVYSILWSELAPLKTRFFCRRVYTHSIWYSGLAPLKTRFFGKVSVARGDLDFWAKNEGSKETSRPVSGPGRWPVVQTKPIHPAGAGYGLWPPALPLQPPPARGPALRGGRTPCRLRPLRPKSNARMG